MAENHVPSLLPKQRLTCIEKNAQVGRQARLREFYMVCLSEPIRQEHSFNKMSLYFPMPLEE